MDNDVCAEIIYTPLNELEEELFGVPAPNITTIPIVTPIKNELLVHVNDVTNNFYSPQTFLDIHEYSLETPIGPYVLSQLEEKVKYLIFELISIFVNEILPNENIVEYTEETLTRFAIYSTLAHILDSRTKSSLGTNGFRFGKSIYTFKSLSYTTIPNAYKKILDELLNTISYPAVAETSELASICHNNLNLLHTQKARGLFQYVQGFKKYNLSIYPLFSSMSRRYVGANTLVLPHDKDLSKLTYPVFIRPCPTRPRHGFVESVVAYTSSAIGTKFKETKYKDISGEMLICPSLKGEYSFVMTPTVFTIGCGNSGATSGHDALTVPYVEQYILPKEFEIDDTPYIEGVHDNHYGLQIVQVRSGPATPITENYIPEDIVVKNIIHVIEDADLLEYEHMIKHAEKGSVVYAPGYGMASHYAAHAISHNIPFLTTIKPEYGMFVHETDNPLESGDWKEIAELLSEFEGLPLQQLLGPTFHDLSTSGKIALLSGHLTLLWSKRSTQLNKLTALGLISFIGLYMLSLFGELRHACYMDRKLHRHGKLYTKLDVMKELQHEYNCEIPRNLFYSKSLGKSVGQYIKQLPSISMDFLSPIWNGAIGGPNWALAAYSMQKLIEIYKGFIEHPCMENWTELVSEWHTCINEQHNNGFILNKFLLHQVFEDAAHRQHALLLEEDICLYITRNILGGF